MSRFSCRTWQTTTSRGEWVSWVASGSGSARAGIVSLSSESELVLNIIPATGREAECIPRVLSRDDGGPLRRLGASLGWMATSAPRPLTRTDVLSTSEVAELLGIPHSTVHELARRG